MNRLRKVVALAAVLLLATTSAAAASPDDGPSPEGSGPNAELIPQAADAPAEQEELFTAASSDFVTVLGRGWGHGRGLSQFGSLGYALDGWSHSQILAHYYGGTEVGSNSNDQMLIHITSLSGLTTVVSSGAEFSVGGVTVAAGSTVKVSAISNSKFRISTSPGICTDTFTQVGDVDGINETLARPERYKNGDSRFYLEISSSADPGDDVTKMLQTCKNNTPQRAYRGSLWALVINSSSDLQFADRDTLNAVPLESYVRGVVPRESPAGWGALGDGKGIEALKSQAVAARSYALSLAKVRLNSSTNYVSDACDTTSCQVYIGAGEWQADGHWKPLDSIGEDPSHEVSANAYSEQATLETAGEIRVWPGGDVAFTEFASSTGGYTSPTSEGNVFGAVPDDGDSVSYNTRHTWTTQISYGSIEAAYPSIGNFESISVTARNGLGAWGGRTRQIVITGFSGSVTIDSANWSGDSFRKKFGLFSDWYRFPDFESQGFWLVRPDGEVSGFGGAADYGDMAGQPLNLPIVGMASSASGFGYWLVATDGGIFAFGDAPFYGSTGNIVLNQPIVAMAAHPDGKGYWFVASDGGVFSYGSSEFYGSMGSIPLVSPVVGMAATPSGRGYWLVAADGGMFAFGDAKFYGSIGGEALASPIQGMAAHPEGKGYWFVATDGTVFAFGSAEVIGAQVVASTAAEIVGIATNAAGSGYWLVQSNGFSYSRSVTDYPTSDLGSPVIGIARQN